MKKVRFVTLVLLAAVIVVLAVSSLTKRSSENLQKNSNKTDERSVRYYNERAVAAVRGYDFQDAVTELGSAIQQDPGSPTLFYNRARVYESLGEFTKASEDYGKAAELDPDGKVGKFAYRRLEVLADKLEQTTVQSEKGESGILYSMAIANFDEAINCYNYQDLNTARETTLLAISLNETAYLLDPSNTELIGFLYMMKGFLYHIIGRQYANEIKPNDTNYIVMAWLRQAYYPFSCADKYYQEADRYLTTPAQQELLKTYIAKNEYFFKMAKKYIPTVDFDGKNYMKNIEKETSAIVDLDRVNSMITAKNFDAIPEFIESRVEDLRTANPDESLNSLGLTYLFRSYYNLSYALKNADNDPEWILQNIDKFENELNKCLAYLTKADENLKNEFLKETVVNIRGVVHSTWQRVKETAGLIYE